MNNPIPDQVRQIAADVFGIPLEEVTLESTQDDIEKWDSLQHINLVMALEQNFSIEILPEEIGEMGKIGDVVQVVEGKLS